MPNSKDYLGHTTVNFVNDKDWYSVNSFKCEIGGKGTPGEPNYNSYHSFLIKNLKSGFFSTSLKASVSVKQQPSSKNNDGVVEVVIDGGTPVFSVLIQDASSKGFYLQKEFSQKGTYELRNIPAGAMKVFIEDSEGCGLILDIALEQTDALCSGKCKEIGTDASKYCKYEWVAHKDIKDTKQSKITVCPTETTTYTLQVIDNDGNKKNINYTVEIKTADVALRTVLLCTGQSKVLTVKGTDPVWSTGEKGTEITVTTTGTYTVTVTDDEGCLIKGTIEVLNGANPDNIKKYFRALGFYENEADIRPQPPTLIGDNVSAKPAGGGCAVTDLTKHSSVFLGDDEVKLRQEFERLCAENLTTAEQFYITENQTVCENYIAFEQAEKDFLSGKKTYWAHKFLNGNQKCLFVNVNYKDKFFLNESEVDLKSEIANMTPVDNFYLYSDRGEAIGEFSSFQYGIPAGIYFIDHKQEYKSKYLQYYKWLYPYTSFTETVDLVFYIDRKLAKYLKNTYETISDINNLKNSTERGGLCYNGLGKKMIIEECIPCRLTSTPLSMKSGDILKDSNYPNFTNAKANYFTASWHAHPDKVQTIGVDKFDDCNKPSGIENGFQCNQYDCDVALIKDKFSDDNYSCLSYIHEVKFHKLASGIGIIAGNHGITIYRHINKNVYDVYDEPKFNCFTSFGGKYYPKLKDSSKSNKSLGYEKFKAGEKIYVISYELNKITKTYSLTP